MERGKFVQLAIPEGEVLPNGKALPPPAPPEILNSEVLYKQIEGDSDVSHSFSLHSTLVLTAMSPEASQYH